MFINYAKAIIEITATESKAAEGIFQTIGHTITPNAWWTI